MKIFVDLDNTLCHTDDKHDYHSSTPYVFAINEINKLYAAGHIITIYTARGSSSGINWSELTKTQLKLWNIKYHNLVDKGKPSWDLLIDDKVLNANDWHKKINPIVGFVASCFDLLHPGHMLMLKDAKSKCDHLIAALQTDPTVDRPHKNKPIQTLEERLIILEGNKYIDEIIIYNNEIDLENLIKSIKPDIRIIGSDWKDKEYTGKGLSKSEYFHERNHNWSSTELKNRIINIYKNDNLKNAT